VTLNVLKALQEPIDEQTSLKAINEFLSVTSRPWQATKLLEKCSNCFSAKVNEEKEEKDDVRVHHHSLMGTNGLRPDQPIVMTKDSSQNGQGYGLLETSKLMEGLKLKLLILEGLNWWLVINWSCIDVRLGRSTPKAPTKLKHLTRQARDVKQALHGRQPSVLNSFSYFSLLFYVLLWNLVCLWKLMSSIACFSLCFKSCVHQAFDVVSVVLECI